MKTDQRATSNWDRAARAYEYYVDYLDAKPDRYSLSLIDLLYVKNFKGGNSIIAEDKHALAQKLSLYEQALRQAGSAPEFQKSLRDLSGEEYERAKARIQKFVEMPLDPESAISGFGVSLASALLHFQFPTVVPILDRRALNGAGTPGLKLNKQEQVTNQAELYPALIDYSRNRLLEKPGLTLRELDREIFSKELGKPFRLSSRGR